MFFHQQKSKLKGRLEVERDGPPTKSMSAAEIQGVCPKLFAIEALHLLYTLLAKWRYWNVLSVLQDRHIISGEHQVNPIAALFLLVRLEITTAQPSQTSHQEIHARKEYRSRRRLVKLSRKVVVYQKFRKQKKRNLSVTLNCSHRKRWCCVLVLFWMNRRKNNCSKRFWGIKT